MTALRKILVVSLFVLLSGVLFTAFLPLVLNALISFYSYRLPPPQSPTLSRDDVEIQKPDAKIDFQPATPEVTPAGTQPFATAQEFMLTSWVSITAGLSLSVTAAVFFFAGLIINRFKPATRN